MSSRKRGRIRALGELRKIGAITEEDQPELTRVAENFPILLSPTMADKVALHPTGPVGKQFIPNRHELEVRPDELADPISDQAHEVRPGLIHRYPDRVLLKLLHACAVYCRFCFRKDQVGPGGNTLTKNEIDAALDYIQGNKAIWEVVFSGGDPFLLSPRKLNSIIGRLSDFDHVRVLRFHTRIPVVEPERVTDELLHALASNKTCYVVVHVNHAEEFSDAAREACARLFASGIPLLSQTVLLKGINDTPDALSQLFRLLVENRIKPYYLHQLDRAKGTSHFHVPISLGLNLVRSLRGRLSGLCQPSYMLDIPGGYGKVPLAAPFIQELSKGSYLVTDPSGLEHEYHEV